MKKIPENRRKDFLCDMMKLAKIGLANSDGENLKYRLECLWIAAKKTTIEDI